MVQASEVQSAMSLWFRCSRGHTWQSSLSEMPGEATGLLPFCPMCGQIGEHMSVETRRRTGGPRESTSRVDSAALVIHPESALPADPYSPPTLPGYELCEEIGRGGMGVVYRAADVRRGGDVAIKCLPRLDPNKLLRFKQEFRALADVSHPNLATVYELTQVGGRWCLVMELVHGVPFTDYFQNIGDVGQRLERLRPALRQLVDAVGFLHDSGLLHCDVKPTNVLVTPEGRVVLLDFGLVTEWKPEGEEINREELVGSLGYIAPERFAGKPPTAAVDWYSIGVMLFETFAGRRPFEGSRTNLIWQQRYMDPPAPSEVTAEVPPGWDQLCVGLLERNPALRFGRTDLAGFLAGDAVPARPAGASLRLRDVPLVGRDRQLAQLESAFQTVKQGRPVLAVIRGLTGMGKSTLVDRFVERIVRREPLTILRGRCYEQESVPYKGVDELVDSLCFFLGEMNEEEFQHLLPAEIGSLARMFPVLRRLRMGAAHWKATDPTDPVELRRQALIALRELLERLSLQAPLILTIDDAQWGDTDSARLLADLLRGPKPPPMLWLVCCRTEDAAAGPCLAELLAAADAEVSRIEVDVGPLSALESASLAQTLLANEPAAGEELAATIAHESQGWPVFVHELASHARAQVALGMHNGPALTLNGVIKSRLSDLTADGRHVLELLAVAAQPLRQITLFQAAALTGEPRSALAALRTGHWLRTFERGGEQFAECFHDTIRQVVTGDLSGENLAARHDRLARALTALHPTEHALLAVHHLGAGRPAEASRHYARAALDAEEALAFDRAAQFLRLALDLAPWPEEETATMWRKLSVALANAGRGVEAAQACLVASGGADRTQALRLRREAAYQFCVSGQVEEGLAAMQAALRTAGLSLPPTSRRTLLSLAWERLRLRWRGWRYRERPVDEISADDLERIDTCWAATAGLSMFDVTAGALFQARHLRHALDAGEPQRLARALAWQAVHSSAQGHRATDAVRQLLEQARRLADRLQHPHAHALLALAEGVVQFNSGRWEAACHYLARAEEQLRTRCLGVTWERTVVQTFLFWSLYQLGEFADLEALAQQMIHQARDRGDRLAATNVSIFALPMSRLAAGDPRGARELIRRSMDDWPRVGFHLQHATSLFSEVRIDFYERRDDDARQRLSAAAPHIRSSGFMRLQPLRITWAHLSGLAAAFNDKKSALRHAHQLDRENTSAAAALAALIRATVTARAGGPAPDLAAMEHAETQLTAAGMHGYAAAVRLTMGQIRTDPSMVNDAERWFSAHGVADAKAMAEMLAPGLVR